METKYVQVTTPCTPSIPLPTPWPPFVTLRAVTLLQEISDSFATSVILLSLVASLDILSWVCAAYALAPCARVSGPKSATFYCLFFCMSSCIDPGLLLQTMTWSTIIDQCKKWHKPIKTGSYELLLIPAIGTLLIACTSVAKNNSCWYWY